MRVRRIDDHHQRAARRGHGSATGPEYRSGQPGTGAIASQHRTDPPGDSAAAGGRRARRWCSEQSDRAPELGRQANRVGLIPVAGPAVTVTLDDAPSSVAANGIEPDLLVVHQQDIQAVVNAFWSGGAEAMTIQGQRVISTTAVKCVGNTVVLHGIPYAPPYEISAIGDQARLRAALAESEPIQIYQQYVEPTVWFFKRNRRRASIFPAHEGSLDLVHAAPYSGSPSIATAPRQRAGLDARREWARACGEDPRDRQLRLVRLQPGAVPGADRRRGRGVAQRRRALRRSRFRDGFDGILLSPGPGTPEEAGVCVDVVQNARRAGCRSSASASGCSRSVSRTAVWSTGRRSCCTARPRSIQPSGARRARRPALALHRHPLPLAGDRAGDRARRASR